MTTTTTTDAPTTDAPTTPTTDATPTVQPFALAEGASQYAALAVDTMRRTDQALAAIAFRTTGSDAKFASAASLAAAKIGEAHLESAFEPTEAVPTWDEHLAQVAGRKPYSVSESQIRDLRNAVRICNVAGIPLTDAVAFEDAKRAARTYTTADKAARFGSALAVESDPRAALAAKTAKRSVSKGASDEAATAKARDEASKRAADPIGYALDALRRKFEGQADALDALARRFDEAAILTRQDADTARKGLVTVPATPADVAAAGAKSGK